MERKNRIEVKLENKEQIHKIAWLVGSANVQQIEGQIKKLCGIRQKSEIGIFDSDGDSLVLSPEYSYSSEVKVLDIEGMGEEEMEDQPPVTWKKSVNLEGHTVYGKPEVRRAQEEALMNPPYYNRGLIGEGYRLPPHNQYVQYITGNGEQIIPINPTLNPTMSPTLNCMRTMYINTQNPQYVLRPMSGGPVQPIHPGTQAQYIHPQQPLPSLLPTFPHNNPRTLSPLTSSPTATLIPALPIINANTNKNININANANANANANTNNTLPLQATFVPISTAPIPVPHGGEPLQEPSNPPLISLRERMISMGIDHDVIGDLNTIARETERSDLDNSPNFMNPSTSSPDTFQIGRAYSPNDTIGLQQRSPIGSNFRTTPNQAATMEDLGYFNNNQMKGYNRHSHIIYFG